MDPRRPPAAPAPTWLPRTRGDGPFHYRGRSLGRPASPHTRGWTHAGTAHRRRRRGFPAHAGMDPSSCSSAGESTWLPRTRGDGPASCASSRPRRAASPHTRGWTWRGEARSRDDVGFPAHAGMDRRRATDPVPRGRLPRTRGDGPGEIAASRTFNAASPHTRGWTLAAVRIEPAPAGFPAHAGMDRPFRLRDSLLTRLPRTRGDGPLPGAGLYVGETASPHTRGWTRRDRGLEDLQRGFPAHAGMDPGRLFFSGASNGLPRTRGDGPAMAIRASWSRAASPHTRGWTP